jgi:hypothetical protein
MQAVVSKMVQVQKGIAEKGGKSKRNKSGKGNSWQKRKLGEGERASWRESKWKAGQGARVLCHEREFPGS